MEIFSSHTRHTTQLNPNTLLPGLIVPEGPPISWQCCYKNLITKYQNNCSRDLDFEKYTQGGWRGVLFRCKLLLFHHSPVHKPSWEEMFNSILNDDDYSTNNKKERDIPYELSKQWLRQELTTVYQRTHWPGFNHMSSPHSVINRPLSDYDIVCIGKYLRERAEVFRAENASRIHQYIYPSQMTQALWYKWHWHWHYESEHPNSQKLGQGATLSPIQASNFFRPSQSLPQHLWTRLMRQWDWFVVDQACRQWAYHGLINNPNIETQEMTVDRCDELIHKMITPTHQQAQEQPDSTLEDTLNQLCASFMQNRKESQIMPQENAWARFNCLHRHDAEHLLGV